MRIGKILAGLFGWNKGRAVEELAARLGMTPDELRSASASYREFRIPKRSGGTRLICAPDPALKKLQCRVLRRLLSRLKCHPSAQGFERGRSIATNARQHAGRAVVVRMDMRDFFPSTSEKRVWKYFRRIGWNREAADILVKLTTHNGGLPQGAPTSPRLSNVVNYRLDARLAAVAVRLGATYTRYADDMTFSFDADEPRQVRRLIFTAERIVKDEGYALHKKKKLHIRRRHQSQQVTGLVVNDTVNLPRSMRRRLRAVEHHVATGRPATLTKAQLAGWRALQHMVQTQGIRGIR